MATTYNQILAAAYGRSSKNIPGKIATDAVELLNLIYRALAGLYSFAADINPQFFGVSTQVVFAAGGWARPANAESVWRIETLAGVEVVTVPIDDKKAELGKPALYRLGQKYFSAGNPLDPVNADLVFFTSKSPAVPALLADNLDASWPEVYNPLLIDETALWLGIKDGRVEELGAVKESRDSWLKLFSEFLDHETTNEVRRMGTTFHSQRRANIALALTGAQQ
jgi:hypothetical protein